MNGHRDGDDLVEPNAKRVKMETADERIEVDTNFGYESVDVDFDDEDFYDDTLPTVKLEPPLHSLANSNTAPSPSSSVAETTSSFDVIPGLSTLGVPSTLPSSIAPTSHSISPASPIPVSSSRPLPASGVARLAVLREELLRRKKSEHMKHEAELLSREVKTEEINCEENWSEKGKSDSTKDERMVESSDPEITKGVNEPPTSRIVEISTSEQCCTCLNSSEAVKSPRSAQHDGVDIVAINCNENGTSILEETKVAPSISSTLLGEQKETGDHLSVKMETSVLDAGFLEAAQAKNEDENADWRFEASDAGSSPVSSDSSTDSSDSDGDDILLSPEEMARMLLDSNLDGESGAQDTAPLRTLNEKPEPILPKPDIIVTKDMAITELGFVKTIMDNHILIVAQTSGDYMVVDQGTALCLANRTVIGALSDTLGQVRQPFYVVGFETAQAIEDAGIVKGTQIFYVNDHMVSVFTEPLRAIKYTDGSNIHDEELADDEIEFSDDEAEAAYKREVKLNKQVQKDAKNGIVREPQFNRNGRRGQRGFAHAARPQNNGIGRSSTQPTAYPTNIKYDDDDEEELYKPLTRPDNLNAMSSGPPPVESRRPRNSPTSNRGRGRGGRGGRGGPDGSRGRGDTHFGHANRNGSGPQGISSNSFHGNQHGDVAIQSSLGDLGQFRQGAHVENSQAYHSMPYPPSQMPASSQQAPTMPFFPPSPVVGFQQPSSSSFSLSGTSSARQFPLAQQNFNRLPLPPTVDDFTTSPASFPPMSAGNNSMQRSDITATSPYGQQEIGLAQLAAFQQQFNGMQQQMNAYVPQQQHDRSHGYGAPQFARQLSPPNQQLEELLRSINSGTHSGSSPP